MRRLLRLLFRVVLLVAVLFGSGCAMLPWPAKPAAVATPAPTPTIKLVVRGVGDRLATNIRAHVSLASRACSTPGAYLGALARRAEEESQDALRAYGYYHATVSTRVSQGPECARVVIEVQPGPRVVVDAVELTVEGAARDDRGFMTPLASLPLTVGASLNHDKYTATKRLVESLALERGYLAGRFVEHRLEVDVARNLAHVRLRYDSGPRYRVGTVSIAQQPQVVREELVRRFLDYKTDQPYEGELVTRFYAALAASQYFDQVDIRPRISAAHDGEVPIDIRLTPRKRHKYSVGVGASTDEGARTHLAYTNRRLNEAGHRLKAEVRASLLEQSMSGEYQIPREHPADEWLSLQAGVKRKNADNFESDETQIGIADTLRRPFGILETRFIHLDHQAFDIGHNNRTSTLLIPGLRWTKTTTNDALYPTRGYSASLEVRGGSGAMLSDVNFIRALASMRLVREVAPRWRLLSRFDAGASWDDNFGALPPTERFFAGGDLSVRGYAFEDLGPKDPRGRVIGGRYLGVFSAEIERSVARRWAVASFVDGGNAFGGSGRDTGLKLSVGAGLRWRSPLGPARIDLAHPLDDDVVLRLHVRIGPDL
ncbi:MAG: outer membrane protein assembly factor [Gammaproteobacteria bacterium]|nr:outer membrane protein assembly factor [Gammaproteobacteria bacterium]